MSSSSLSRASEDQQIGSASGRSREAADLQMDQIRDLLFGELKGDIAARFAAIEARFAVLEQQIADMRHDDDNKRRAAFDALARNVADLGTQISTLAQS